MEILPDSIPNLVRVPIKDLIAPVHILITYYRKSKKTSGKTYEEVSSYTTDLGVYFSTIEKEPFKAYRVN